MERKDSERPKAAKPKGRGAAAASRRPSSRRGAVLPQEEVATTVGEPWASDVFTTAHDGGDEVGGFPSWADVNELMGDDLLAGPLPLLFASLGDEGDVAPSRQPTNRPLVQSLSQPRLDTHPAEAFWLWGAPTTRSEVAHLKLSGGPLRDPADLPPGLPQALASMFDDRAPLTATAAVQPGCVLLTYDALVPADAAELDTGRGRQERLPDRSRDGAPTLRVAAPSAVEALTRLRAHPGALSHFLRRCGAAVLRLSCSASPHTAYADLSGDVTAVQSAGSDASHLAPSAEVPCCTVPCAALCTAAVVATVYLPTAAAAAQWVRSGVRARMHGHWVPCQVTGTSPDGMGVCVLLPAVGLSGLVVLEPAAGVAGQQETGNEAAAHVEHLLPPQGPSAALVLTSEPALVAELVAGAPARCVAAPEQSQAAVDAAVERHNALVLLGHALWRLSPCRVVARAAAVCLRHGWTAASLACVSLLVDAYSSTDAPDGGKEGDLLTISLLHEVSASGKPAMMDALIAARATLITRHGAAAHVADCVFGAPGRSSPFPDGSLTPLHICTMAPSGPATSAALTAATRMLAGPRGSEYATDEAGDAVVAWFSTRGGAQGMTPSAMAAARGAQDPFAQLDATLRTQLALPRRLALAACAAAQEKDGVLVWPLTCEAAVGHLPLAGGNINPWTLVLARALLRDAARAVPHTQPAQPRGAAARLWLTLTSALRASPPDEHVTYFQNAWRLARLSWLVHTFLLVQVLYLVGSILRWARAPVPTAALFRSMECHPAEHWPHAGLAAPGVEYPSARWAVYARMGVIDYVATLGLPLEAAVTAALSLCMLLPRPRAWLTTPGTARVQALLFLQAACHGCLVTVAMTYRSTGHILAARGAHVAWPLHSSVVMLVFQHFLYGCLPITPAAAAPVLATRAFLALASWWHPARWARLWPVPQTPALGLQLLAVAMASGIVLWREAWLRGEYAREYAGSGQVKGAHKAKHV
jgi:hypothetical protein